MLTLRPGAVEHVYVPEWCDDVRSNHDLWGMENVMSMEREVQELLYGLVRALKPNLTVEIGSYEGGTAEVLGNAIEDNGFGFLMTIEREPELAAKAQERCAHLQHVSVVNADALDVARSGALADIDFLVVDGGSHRDLEHQTFEPLLAKEAVVVRHDVLSERWGLKDGELEGFDTVVLRTPRGVAISQRRA
jgi:predicted O-methyltransferase YrrM